MNDFYFVYYPVGPQFIKTMMVTFKYIPEYVNVIVMTPTPELLKDIDVKFNLIVVDSNDIIDDFSREYEPVIKETDHDIYIEKLRENYSKGIRFSASTHRYIIPWLVDRGISKFAILDTDCLINFHNEVKIMYDDLRNRYNGKNLLFGPIMHQPTYDFSILAYLKDVFESEGIEWETLKSIEAPMLAFDGWLRGFWFEDIELLKKYFRLWDNSLKETHRINASTLYGNNWTVPDEWLVCLISMAFKKKYDVCVDDVMGPPVYSGTTRIVKHIYHPENDFFSLHHDYLYKHMFNLSMTNSREEFFEKNKEQLIKFYTIQNAIPKEDISNVIYDYSKYN